MYTFSLGKYQIRQSEEITNYDYSLMDLENFFSNPKKLNSTYENFSYDDKCRLEWWSGAHYDNQRRRDCFKSRNLITLDIDYGNEETLDLIKSKLSDICYFLHSSVSYNPLKGKYKYRLIIPTSINITSLSQYQQTAKYFIDMIGENLFDVSTSIDITRALFSPVKLLNINYVYIYNKVSTTTTIFNKHFSTTDDVITKRRLPSTLDGIEGIFCSVYKAYDVMREYAPDTDYEPSGDPTLPTTRWTYKHGSSKHGIRFEDNGELLHCDHETSPLSSNKIKLGNKQWSAYDLYVYFVHEGNLSKADKAIKEDPKIINHISNFFDDLDKTINKLTDYSLPSSLGKFISDDMINTEKRNNNFKSKLKFIKDNVYLFSSTKDVYFLFQTIDPFTNKTRQEMFKEGNPIKSVLGNCEILAKDGKKLISIWDIAKYILPTYRSFNFMPYNPKTIPVNYGNSFINLFTGFTVNHLAGDYSDNPGVKAFTNYLLEVICSHDNLLYTWVLDWIADIFQDPQNKKGTAIALYSKEKGTGKSMMFTLLKKLLGSMAISKDQNTMLASFNADLAETLLVIIEEPDYKMKKVANTLRDCITSKTRNIRKLYQDSYEALDCTRYIMASNKDDFLDIDDNERRYTAINVSNTYCQNTTYFKNLLDIFESNKSEILTFLLDHKITTNLCQPYKTSLHQKMVENNTSPITQMLDDLYSMDLQDIKDIFDNPFEHTFKIDHDYVNISKQTFKKYYINHYGNTTTPHTFTKMIKSADPDILCSGNESHVRIGDKVQSFVRIPVSKFNL